MRKMMKGEFSRALSLERLKPRRLARFAMKVTKLSPAVKILLAGVLAYAGTASGDAGVENSLGAKDISRECVPRSAAADDGPLWRMDGLSYVGGFRVNSDQHGESEFASADFSFATFALSEGKNSFFLVGNTRESRIAEFQIPQIINTTDVAQMAKAQPIQNFALFNDAENRFDTGIAGYFRVSGMREIDGKLIVNYFNWYDANGTETDTTAVFLDSGDLENSALIGPFQLEGAARSAGWISPVPLEWQSRLGGSHISGWAQGSINSRLSNGPSAYIWNPHADLLNETSGKFVPASAGMSFPLNNILYSNSLYGDLYDGSMTWNAHIMTNADLKNDLWTYMSGATYGFIVPGSNTYVTLGVSGGINSGIGYKYVRPDGTSCAGHCPKDADDIQNYYWLWRVSDIEKVLKGEIEPYEIRPYDYGEFDTKGKKARLASGYFDPDTNRLYVSLRAGDTLSAYRRPPLFLVYELTR